MEKFLKKLIVLLPYKFTLLSNGDFGRIPGYSVLLPYKFTLLSNIYVVALSLLAVLLPYKFTLLSNSNTSFSLSAYGFTTL